MVIHRVLRVHRVHRILRVHRVPFPRFPFPDPRSLLKVKMQIDNHCSLLKIIAAESTK